MWGPLRDQGALIELRRIPRSEKGPSALGRVHREAQWGALYLSEQPHHCERRQHQYRSDCY